MSEGGSFRYGTSSNAAAEVAVVRALYAAFARRDVAAAAPYLDEGFELFPTGTAELTGRAAPYLGPEGMRQYLEDVQRVWSELELVADDVRAIAGSVIVFGHVRGTPAGTDLVVERRVLWTWKLRDGRAISLRVNDVG
jgi:ketosteroid isomerase-like protein